MVTVSPGGLALSALVLARYKPDGWGDDVALLVRFLRGRQLIEWLGWTEDDPEYGGWDHGALVPRKPDSRKPEISVTAFAVEALRAGGVPPDDPAIRKALVFLSRCRNADGGYFFTPDDAADVLLRTKTSFDSATPAGNAVIAGVLARLYYLTGEERFRERSEAVIQAFAGETKRNVFPLSTLVNSAELLQSAVQVES